MKKIQFDEINAAALTQAQALLALWLPDGQVVGHEFVCRNPTRADNAAGSFKINLSNGRWSDFATGDAGGDLISLYAYIFNVKQGEAAKAIAEAMHLNISDPVSAVPASIQPKPSSAWEWMAVVPDDAPFMPVAHPVRGPAQRISKYLNTDGRLIGAVLRFPTSSGGKEDIPLTLWKNTITGKSEWRWRVFPDPRPIYGAEKLCNPGKILIVEGEKCKDAAAEYFKDEYIVLSWAGGAKAVSKTDWSLLNGREVILWPDADSKRERLSKADKDEGVKQEDKPLLEADKQPGMAAMLWLADELKKQNCEVAWVEIPAPGIWTDGYDIADAIEEGQLAYVNPREAVQQAQVKEQSPCPASLPPPPPPPDNNAQSLYNLHFKRLMADFVLIEGKDRAFDKNACIEYGRRALIAHFSKDAVDSWFNSGLARTFTQAEVNKLKKDKAAIEALKDKEVADIMERYVYLDGSTSIWDMHLWRMIDQSAAKLAMGDSFKLWCNSPMRIVKRFEDVVFEPGRDMPEDKYINVFRGLPLQDKLQYACPREQMPTDWLEVIKLYPGCLAIQRLIAHLCNNDLRVIEFLYNWLAYPLQHVGAKMNTAIVMHGNIHGAGKSWLFDGIMREIYGTYSDTHGQQDLESKYTGNRSGKLLIVFEEIFNNKQKYDQTGAMKHLITGKTMRVERKFVDSYEEANHINCVFLSNESQPFKIEEADRRYTVIWPERKLPESLRVQLQEEIGNGGIEQFYALLMSLPLTLTYDRVINSDGTEGFVKSKQSRRFDAFTQAIPTLAKQNVITYGQYPWQIFYYEWSNNFLDGVRYGTCCGDDLWKLFQRWCKLNNERESSKAKFLQNIASKLPQRRKRVKFINEHECQRRVYLAENATPPPGVSEKEYLGKILVKFKNDVSAYSDIKLPNEA